MNGSMRENARDRQRKQLLRNWRCEQAPSMDGPWMTADAADGAVTIAIAPPGTAITGAEDESCESWRMAWWPAGSNDDLLGFSRAGELVVPLDDLLTFMPARIADRARAWELAAQEQRQALAAGSPEEEAQAEETQERVKSQARKTTAKAKPVSSKASRRPELNLIDALQELATS
jgi:hypothetical protein